MVKKLDEGWYKNIGWNLWDLNPIPPYSPSFISKSFHHWFLTELWDNHIYVYVNCIMKNKMGRGRGT